MTVSIFSDDPLEQRDLFDQRPDIVQKLLAKINHFKRISKQSVFSLPGPVNNVTTQIMFGDVTVPRFGYCTPATDFPHRPRNASCNANLPPLNTGGYAYPYTVGYGRFATNYY